MKIPLTQQALAVLDRAEQESRQFNHDFVGTEHILLALLDEYSGITSSTLTALGLAADAFRHEIAAMVLNGTPNPNAPRQLPLTPRAG